MSCRIVFSFFQSFIFFKFHKLNMVEWFVLGGGLIVLASGIILYPVLMDAGSGWVSIVPMLIGAIISIQAMRGKKL